MYASKEDTLITIFSDGFWKPDEEFILVFEIGLKIAPTDISWTDEEHFVESEKDSDHDDYDNYDDNYDDDHDNHDNHDLDDDNRKRAISAINKIKRIAMEKIDRVIDRG